MAEIELLREYYATLNDRELQRLAKGELVAEARAVLEIEMRSRGFVPGTVAGNESSVPNSLVDGAATNPYLPPGALVSDLITDIADLKVSGLLRIFQSMVIASTLIGLFLFLSPYLSIPISDRSAILKGYGGTDALVPAVTQIVYLVAQPLWIVAAIGLYFLRWWGRVMLVGIYLLSGLGSLLGGMFVYLPWESLLGTAATLMDGAVLALAFLPPLSKYFRKPGVA